MNTLLLLSINTKLECASFCLRDGSALTGSPRLICADLGTASLNARQQLKIKKLELCVQRHGCLLKPASRHHAYISPGCMAKALFAGRDGTAFTHLPKLTHKDLGTATLSAGAIQQLKNRKVELCVKKLAELGFENTLGTAKLMGADPEATARVLMGGMHSCDQQYMPL